MPPDAAPAAASRVSSVTSATTASADFSRVNCELIGLANLGRTGRRLVSFSPDFSSGELRGSLPTQVDVGALVSVGMPPRLLVVGGRNDTVRGRVYQVDLATGQARPLFDTALDRVVAGTSDANGTLFAWSRGLVRIDIQARTTERLVASNLPVEQLAVGDHGVVLAYTQEAVFRYDPSSRGLVRLGQVATHLDALAGTGARLLALRSPEEIAPRVELLLTEATTASVRRSRTLAIADLDVRGAPHPFTHLTWPAACPSPRMEERGDVIQSVTAEPANPCIGETVTLRVVALDTANPTAPVTTSIDGLPGPTRVVQVPRIVPGPHLYGAWAMTEDGLYDLEDIVVDVRECPSLHAPLLLGAANPYDPKRLDLWLANPTEFGIGARYDFDFGDGTSVSTTAPHASHDLSSSSSCPTEV